MNIILFAELTHLKLRKSWKSSCLCRFNMLPSCMDIVILFLDIWYFFLQNSCLIHTEMVYKEGWCYLCHFSFIIQYLALPYLLDNYSKPVFISIIQYGMINFFQVFQGYFITSVPGSLKNMYEFMPIYPSKIRLIISILQMRKTEIETCLKPHQTQDGLSFSDMFLFQKHFFL